MGETVDHEADHGEGDHGLGDLGEFLIVLGEASPSTEPAEGAFHHPAAGKQDEAGAACDPADDDQGEVQQEAGQPDGQAIIGAVGKDRLEPAIERLDPLQEAQGAGGVLDVGGMDDNPEQQAGGVDGDVALAAFDLLGGIIAARPPFSVVFTLWLSMTAAVGLASRPSCSRSIISR